MALDVISAALDLGGKLLDRVMPDPAQKAAAQLELLKLAQTGELAQLTADTQLAQGQIGVNAVEAANPSIFVSGWRPFIGWVCGSGLAYQFILAPLLTWGGQLLNSTAVAPSLDMSTLITLLAGMLGLGGMRTMERLNGVART